MSRRKHLGDLGEQWTVSLLKNAGFRSILNLNAVRHNHPGGDFVAERQGQRYFVTVKARCKYTRGTRKLNSGYNIFPDKVRRAAREYDAIPAWLTIQVDTDLSRFSAYFGTIQSLRNPNAVAVPMSARAVSSYECLANDKFDQAITPELSNQLEDAMPTAKQELSKRESRKPASYVASKRGSSVNVSFEDHVAYTEPSLRPILRELRTRISSLGPNVKETVTASQRIAYSVRRQFVEVKVQKKRILLRFFSMGVNDPRNLVIDIPESHGWRHDKQLAVDNMELVDYAMEFIQASYRSRMNA